MGVLPPRSHAIAPWTYADESMCMQSYVNYPAILFWYKATSIDTARHPNSINLNTTCAQRGYTNETHGMFKDIPKIFNPIVVGVSTWGVPKALGSSLKKKCVTHVADHEQSNFRCCNGYWCQDGGSFTTYQQCNGYCENSMSVKDVLIDIHNNSKEYSHILEPI